jgi:acetyl-CoA acetyltransferase
VNEGLRGRTAVVGVGESTYYRRGESPAPEFVLGLRAVLAACADAGIDPSAIDGIVSYGDEHTDPSRMAAAIGCTGLRHASMVWGSGGGGVSAAVGHGAAAILAGLADCVVVLRAISQGSDSRYGLGAYGRRSSPASSQATVAGERALTHPYGLLSPAQMFAMRVNRMLETRGVGRDAMRAVALACYHHGQRNPRAVMHGRPLTAEMYDDARWIVEPFRLFDCCQESDGAAAVLLVSAERARDCATTPAYLLAAASGGEHRSGARAHNSPLYDTAHASALSARLWSSARIGPDDVDVVQVYENFTGGVVMSLVEHGFCDWLDVDEFLTVDELLAPGGRLPLNTSGGNLAECYVHGLELHVEAVRQLRGESCNQVPGATVALAAAGPMVPITSSIVYGAEATL